MKLNPNIVSQTIFIPNPHYRIAPKETTQYQGRFFCEEKLADSPPEKDTNIRPRSEKTQAKPEQEPRRPNTISEKKDTKDITATRQKPSIIFGAVPPKAAESGFRNRLSDKVIPERSNIAGLPNIRDDSLVVEQAIARSRSRERSLSRDSDEPPPVPRNVLEGSRDAPKSGIPQSEEKTEPAVTKETDITEPPEPPPPVPKSGNPVEQVAEIPQEKRAAGSLVEKEDHVVRPAEKKKKAVVSRVGALLSKRKRRRRKSKPKKAKKKTATRVKHKRKSKSVPSPLSIPPVVPEHASEPQDSKDEQEVPSPCYRKSQPSETVAEQTDPPSSNAFDDFVLKRRNKRFL